MNDFSYSQNERDRRKEFFEDCMNSRFFDDRQKELIKEGYDANLSLEKLKLFAKVGYTTAQMEQILLGIFQGLNLEQLENYAYRDCYSETMKIIRENYRKNLEPEKMDLLIYKNFDYAQVKEINQGIKDNLTFEQLLTFAKPEINWKIMNMKREQLSSKDKKNFKRLVRKRFIRF